MHMLRFGALIHLTASAARSEEPIGVVGMLAAATIIVLLTVLVVWAIFFRRGDGDGSDPGDDEGPGRRRPPPTPPPDPGPTVSWPEFERQFAEHVTSRSQGSSRAG